MGLAVSRRTSQARFLNLVEFLDNLNAPGKTSIPNPLAVKLNIE